MAIDFHADSHAERLEAAENLAEKYQVRNQGIIQFNDFPGVTIRAGTRKIERGEQAFRQIAKLSGFTFEQLAKPENFADALFKIANQASNKQFVLNLGNGKRFIIYGTGSKGPAREQSAVDNRMPYIDSYNASSPRGGTDVNASYQEVRSESINNNFSISERGYIDGLGNTKYQEWYAKASVVLFMASIEQGQNLADQIAYEIGWSRYATTGPAQMNKMLSLGREIVTKLDPGYVARNQRSISPEVKQHSYDHRMDRFVSYVEKKDTTPSMPSGPRYQHYTPAAKKRGGGFYAWVNRLFKTSNEPSGWDNFGDFMNKNSTFRAN